MLNANAATITTSAATATVSSWLQNKKSELMLIKPVRACSQIFLVYLHPSRHKSIFSSQKSLKKH